MGLEDMEKVWFSICKHLRLWMCLAGLPSRQGPYCEKGVDTHPAFVYYKYTYKVEINPDLLDQTDNFLWTICTFNYLTAAANDLFVTI